MKIKYDGSEMLAIMNVVRRCSDHTSEIANNTRLLASGSSVAIRHCDLYHAQFDAMLPCTVTEEGASVVSGYAFYKAVQKIGKKPQEYGCTVIEGEPGGLVFSGDKEADVYHTPAGSNLDFTAGKRMKRPLPENGWSKIDKKALETLFEHTYRCASTDPHRYFMNGVYLENMPGGLRGVATDGRHLALVEVPGKVKSFAAQVWVDSKKHDKGKEAVTHTVPLRYIPAIRALLELAPEWEMLINNRYLGLRSTDGRYTLQVQLIEGWFPNYHRVMPSEHLDEGEVQKFMQLEMSELKEILRELRAEPIYQRNKKDERIWVKIEGLTEAYISIRDALQPEVQSGRRIDIYTQDEPTTVLLNGEQLDHAIASIKGTARFEWLKPGRVWTITPEQLPDGVSKLLFLTMPMNE